MLPANIARLVSSISSYACTENIDTLFEPYTMDCELKQKVDEKEVSVQITSGFPYEGKVTLTVNCDTPTEMTLALRLPDWAKECVVNGVSTTNEALCGGEASPVRQAIKQTARRSCAEVSDAYLYLAGTWSGRSERKVDFP